MELQWLIVGILMRYFVLENSHLKYINLVYLSIISGYINWYPLTAPFLLEHVWMPRLMQTFL